MLSKQDDVSHCDMRDAKIPQQGMIFIYMEECISICFLMKFILFCIICNKKSSYVGYYPF